MPPLSELPPREPAVRALWRIYYDGKDRAAIAQSELDGWDARRKALENLIEANEAVAREVIDILSQIGERVERVPERDEVQ